MLACDSCLVMTFRCVLAGQTGDHHNLCFRHTDRIFRDTNADAQNCPLISLLPRRTVGKNLNFALGVQIFADLGTSWRWGTMEACGLSWKKSTRSFPASSQERKAPVRVSQGTFFSCCSQSAHMYYPSSTSPSSNQLLHWSSTRDTMI